MLVLLTNDDGIGAEGILALEESLEQHGHEVWIVAPASNRSGVSHGISFSGHLRIEKHKSRAYSCSGNPADCVIAAVDALLPRKPDVVLSGINDGTNIGTDVLLSGTVAAARQASFYGIPAVAVSLITRGKIPGLITPPKWKNLADFAVQNLDVFAKICGEDVFANVNAASFESYKGFKITGLCRRNYCDAIHVSPAPDEGDGCFFDWVFEGGSVESVSSPGDDWDAVKSGYISVSAVSPQPCVSENMQAAFRSAPFSCNSINASND